MKQKKSTTVSLFAILGMLLAGIVCSGVFVANGDVGKMVPSIADTEEIRTFMATRIEHCGNTDMVISLLGYVPDYKVPDVLTWRDVPWGALLPAFVLSELKTALPFVVLAVGLTLVITRRRTKAGMERSEMTAPPS